MKIILLLLHYNYQTMKKTFSIILAALSLIAVKAQNNYKQDFLPMMNKVPANVTTAEASYNFMACKDKSCNEFINVQSIQLKANNELSAIQASASMSAVPGGGMSQDEMKKMAKKMETMSDAEKQAFAMQMAMSASAPAPRANQDMNNAVVTDAAQYLANLQEKTMSDLNRAAGIGTQMDSISQAFKPKKDALVKKFRSESKTEHDPMMGQVYVFGEATEQEIARYNAAMATFKKDIAPVLNDELNEKIKFLNKYRQAIIADYRTAENKIMATHYADDAKEPSNRGFIFSAHMKILQNVMTYFKQYESVLMNTATQYATIFGKEQVKSFDIPE